MSGTTGIATTIQGLNATQFQDGQGPFATAGARVRNLVTTLAARTPQIRSTDAEYGAIGNGASNPLAGITAFAGVTNLTQLAAVTTSGGATPYAWATNPLYGLTFTKTTSAGTTTGTTLTLGSLSGDIANPAQYLVVGMAVSGTNIPAGTTIVSISFTSGTPNAIDGPLAGTIVISKAVAGAVASGATITFAYTAALIGGLQMDWLGIQAAEYACGQTTLGLHHYTPAGNYIVNRTIIRSDTPLGSFQTAQSSWVGDGMVNTRLNWTADLGFGTWAVSPPSRVAGTTSYSDMQQMSLWGPGNINTMGVAGCNVQGLASTADFFAYRVSCRGFYSGLNIVNDHQIFLACSFQGNFYNVYFAPYAAQNTGDQSFIDCFMDGCAWASMACAGDNEVVTALLERCHMGYGPYAVYKESGSVTNFLINSTFVRVSMEACGNGGIYDSNPTGLISGCEFIGTDIALDTTNAYEITSRPTYAAVYAGYLEYTWFHGEGDPYTAGYNRGTHPYSLGIIAAQTQVNNCKFWNATNLLAVGSASFPSVYSYYGVSGVDVRWDAGSASGTFRTVSGAITAGVFVSVTNYGLAIALSSTNPAVIGLAWYGATGSLAGATIAVCDGGLAVANKTNTTDVIAAGNYVQIHSTSDGSVVAFNSGARTSTVGIVWNATTNSQTTVYIEVSVKGP